MSAWYEIENMERVDTPALAVYPARIQENIDILKTFVPDVSRLRPHVKTNKSEEVSRMLLDVGITRFKCATIAEAEMLAQANAPDVLLAYQPVGPKFDRLLALAAKYPDTEFSCLIDNWACAQQFSIASEKAGLRIAVYLDLNVGMNRTGIEPAHALALFNQCQALKGIRVAGLHAYDGHIRDADLRIRQQNCDRAYAPVEVLVKKMHETNPSLNVVAGGTPTFPIHAKREGVECSPGTFIYWDIGYQQLLKDQPFVFAALVLTRVISKPSENILCLDLGHKSIASENPIDKRVVFLNGMDLQPVGHSEEHLTVRCPDATKYQVGDVFYGVPYHICPTVALHDTAVVVDDHRAGGKWSMLSRNRSLTV